MPKSSSFFSKLTSPAQSAQETVNETICEALPILCAHWARRNQRLLVLNGELAFHLPHLWEAGFDITAHATTSQGLGLAQATLGQRAEYMLSRPDSLMCDDNFFDYTFYLGALETSSLSALTSVVKELHRVTVTGLVIVFANSFSPFRAKVALGKFRKNPLYDAAYSTCNPLAMRHLLKKEFPKSHFHWFFINTPPRLLPNSPHWRRTTRRFLRWCPLNALYAVRIDFAPQPGCTGLVLRASNIHA